MRPETYYEDLFAERARQKEADRIRAEQEDQIKEGKQAQRNKRKRGGGWFRRR